MLKYGKYMIYVSITIPSLADFPASRPQDNDASEEKVHLQCQDIMQSFVPCNVLFR